MTYRLEIILFDLPPSANHRHGHWAIQAKSNRDWRQKAKLSCMTQKRPPKPLSKAKLTCTRHSAREPDHDNLVSSFKAIIDGIKDAGVIEDDKSSVVVERKYLWQRAAPKDGRVSVVVEEA